MNAQRDPIALSVSNLLGIEEDQPEGDLPFKASLIKLADADSRPARSLEDESSRSQKIMAVLRGLAPHSRKHRRFFVGGTCAAFGVVGAKLALPWPLRAVADTWNGGTHNAMLALVPGGIDPVIAMGILFLLLGFGLGLFDMLERVYFARFAIGTVKDLRADVMSKALANGVSNSGDLVSRFVGDSSRVSAGIRSFLVHVGTSLILLLGMTIILFHMEPLLGFIFLGAGAGTLIITAYVARKMFISSMRTRKKEGKLANRLYAAMNNETVSLKRLNREGRGASANHTRLQGTATWSAHALFGGAVLGALWVGSNAVAAGTMSAGDMVVFMMYALMLQSPTVRLARQGAKCGKIFGSAYRLLQIGRAGNSNGRT